MQSNILTRLAVERHGVARFFFHFCLLMVLASVAANLRAEADMGQDDFPDIRGAWVSNSGGTSNNVSTYYFSQDKQYLTGRYTDEQNGQLVMESPINGFIDKQGNIIFDLYFGKVTATNRLSLSQDGKTLEGSFSTTMGNKGNVLLIRQD